MKTRILTGLVAFAVAASGAAASPPDDQPSAELKEYHRHHQHGGITQFVEMGLDTLGVDPARRAEVEKVQAELHACTEPVEEKEVGVFTVAADGVAAGEVDAAKVEAGVADLNAAAASIHECVAPKLNELHAALSPVEREALADKVQAHWAVWRHVNVDSKPGGREPGGRLAELTRELSLKPDQEEKMSPALQAALASLHSQIDADKIGAQVQRFAGAFAGAAFDATSVTTTTTAALTAYGARRMALFYRAIAPLLTPEQRALLASHLREHANHHPAEGGSP